LVLLLVCRGSLRRKDNKVCWKQIYTSSWWYQKVESNRDHEYGPT